MHTCSPDNCPLRKSLKKVKINGTLWNKILNFRPSFWYLHTMCWRQHILRRLVTSESKPKHLYEHADFFLSSRACQPACTLHSWEALRREIPIEHPRFSPRFGDDEHSTYLSGPQHRGRSDCIQSSENFLAIFFSPSVLMYSARSQGEIVWMPLSHCLDVSRSLLANYVITLIYLIIRE